MCGLLFNYKIGSLAAEVFEKALSSMSSRGPDNTDIEYFDNVSVGHVRLSILDVSINANQPMWSNDNQYVLVFNGEIYNFQELRDELLPASLSLKTKSDTEVLLYLLVYNDLEFVIKQLKGMFSFVFYDIKKETGFFARDHFGQKPLYYSDCSEQLSVSSSIVSIRDILGTRAYNVSAYHTYMSTRGIIEPGETFYRNIKELPAGHICKFNKSEIISITEYFSPGDLIDSDFQQRLSALSHETLLSELDSQVKDSVISHLISDVPVGVLLSGGIDSSLVYWYAMTKNNKISAFSKITPGTENIPLTILPKIIESKPTTTLQLVQTHHDYVPSLWEFIKWWGMPPPWGGGVPMTALCESAKKLGTKVLLGGDCVDEYFAGYESYHSQFKNFAGNIFDLGGQVGIDKSSPFYNEKNCGSYTNYQYEYRKKMFNMTPSWISNNERFMQACLLHDTGVFLQKCNLPNSDAYSMKASVELRNPFLDLDLVGFVVNLPFKFKYSNTGNGNYELKALLRHLAKRKIGDYIDVKKEGTRNYSMRISNMEYWDILSFKLNDILNIPNDLNNKDMFKLICLEMFHRLHILNDGSSFTDMLTDLGHKELIDVNS